MTGPSGTNTKAPPIPSSRRGFLFARDTAGQADVAALRRIAHTTPPPRERQDQASQGFALTSQATLRSWITANASRPESAEGGLEQERGESRE